MVNNIAIITYGTPRVYANNLIDFQTSFSLKYALFFQNNYTLPKELAKDVQSRMIQ